MGCMTRFFFSVMIQTRRTSCSWWGARLKLWKGTWWKSSCQVSGAFNSSCSACNHAPGADVHPSSSHLWHNTLLYRSVRQDSVTSLQYPPKFLQSVTHQSVIPVSFLTVFCPSIYHSGKVDAHPSFDAAPDVKKLLCWGSDGGIAFDTAKVFLQTLGRPSPPFLPLSSLCYVR